MNGIYWLSGVLSAYHEGFCFMNLIKTTKLLTSFLSDFLLIIIILFFCFSYDAPARFRLVASPLPGFRDVPRFYVVTYISPTLSFQAEGPKHPTLPDFSC